MYGQLVLGPPGSGKTTYCDGIDQMCVALQRQHVMVNLDPANDFIPYTCHINVQQLVNVREAMTQYQLGPNGALIYCMEYLLANFDWLEQQLRNLKATYVVFDCPGQVELYGHYDIMRQLVVKLEKTLNCRLTCVHLIDSTLCTDGYNYISALLVSLSGQIMVELPHVNVLTKIDLLRKLSKDLDFRLDFYAETHDLSQLLLLLRDQQPTKHEKFAALNAAICELVEDYNLIAFRPLDVQDKESVLAILKEVDNANGFSLGSLHADLSLFDVAITSTESMGDKWGALHERYIDQQSDDNDGEEEEEEVLVGCDEIVEEHKREFNNQ
eukprot:GHVS01093672.1.p1 GENE.GHVS01093672.1~~GHVS01093672.1.p1  ORF type:complete len:326 (+),score=72.80 GHVS01093672.1:130-1107(+)